MAKMIAKRRFRYGVKVLVPGEEFETARDFDARMLMQLGRASLADELAAMPELETPRTKRAYKRRDMEAEK